MNDNKGQFWNGNAAHDLNGFDSKATIKSDSGKLNAGALQALNRKTKLVQGEEQYMSVDEKSVS
jgi:hypothetical protein